MIPPWAEKEFKRVPKFTAEELAAARAPLDTHPIPEVVFHPREQPVILVSFLTLPPEVKPTTITLATIKERRRHEAAAP